jgi:hypothetical protein
LKYYRGIIMQSLNKTTKYYIQTISELLFETELSNTNYAYCQLDAIFGVSSSIMHNHEHLSSVTKHHAMNTYGKREV